MKKNLLTLILILLLTGVLTAEESTPPTPKTPAPQNPEKDAPQGIPKNRDDEPVDEPPDGAKSARYSFAKDADAETLIDFCRQLQEYEPEDDADAKRHEKKMPRAIQKACKRILDLESDKESDNARYARRMLLAMKLDSSRALDDKNVQKLIAKASRFLASPQLSTEDAEVASALADFLGDHVSPQSIDCCKTVGSELARNADHELAAAGKILLGTARRLDLIGRPLPLKGTTIDGKSFDIASYDTKTVLVIFWASWCDHCVAEISNIKTAYERYHAKGFEVVGIAADDDRTDLSDFLKLEQIPWITLYENGGNHPAFEQFGINGFPTTLLIGKDGKVASLNVRDNALNEELRTRLGEPDAAKEIKKPDAPAKDETLLDDEENDAGDSIEKLKKKFSF